jgi:hypothetical protein
LAPDAAAACCAPVGDAAPLAVPEALRAFPAEPDADTDPVPDPAEEATREEPADVPAPPTADPPAAVAEPPDGVAAAVPVSGAGAEAVASSAAPGAGPAAAWPVFPAPLNSARIWASELRLPQAVPTSTSAAASAVSLTVERRSRACISPSFARTAADEAAGPAMHRRIPAPGDVDRRDSIRVLD